MVLATWGGVLLGGVEDAVAPGHFQAGQVNVRQDGVAVSAQQSVQLRREADLWEGKRGAGMWQAREILYYPSEEDMELYPLLLRGAAPGSPLAEAHLRTQIDALRSLYLCFCRTWRLMKPFIAAGGLSALVDMMVHDNLHVRGQVFEVFLALTDEELYAWHEPPPGGSLLQGPDAPVWKAMLSLASKPLVAHLVQHFDNPFPGAASSAVRILAFHASWLRLHCCRDNVLRMSQLLLDALKKLSLKDPSHGSELARKLHDDFSRFGPASGSGGAAALGSEGYVAAEGEDDDGLSYHVVSSRTVIADPQANESEEAKLRGNDAFRSGNFTAAIQHYSAALDAPVPTARLVEEGERRAVYHTNRAAAYLLRAAAGGGAKGEVELAGHLEGVELGTADALQRHYRATVLDCQQALDLQPCCSSTRFKALWRKSQAEEHLGDWQAALSSAESALTHCRCAGDKSTVQALVHRMQQRLGMLVIDLNEMD